MVRKDALESLKGVVKRSGLIAEGSTGVVLISGGADSTCLAAALAEYCGRPNVHALHLNYGLRESAGDDVGFQSGERTGDDTSP